MAKLVNKLSDKTVLNILKTFNTGTLSQTQIARRFKTTSASVSRIVNGLQRVKLTNLV